MCRSYGLYLLGHFVVALINVYTVKLAQLHQFIRFKLTQMMVRPAGVKSHQKLGQTFFLFCLIVVVCLGTQTQSEPAQSKAMAEGQSFYHPNLLLDVGSGDVNPISSCIIQNLQTSCFSWYMMYET